MNKLCTIIDGGLSFLTEALSQASKLVVEHYRLLKANNGSSDQPDRWQSRVAAALNLGIDLMMKDDKEIADLVKEDKDVKLSVNRFMESLNEAVTIDDMLACMTSAFTKIQAAQSGGSETEALKGVAKLTQLIDKTTLLTDPACAEVLLEITASVGNERGRQHWESDFSQCKGIMLSCIQNAVHGEGEVAVSALTTLLADARKMKKHLFQGTCWFCPEDSATKKMQLDTLYGMILLICEARSWFDNPVDFPKDYEALVKVIHQASSADLSMISDDSKRSSFREFAVKLGRTINETTSKVAASSLECLALAVATLKDLTSFCCLCVCVCLCRFVHRVSVAQK